MQRKTRRLIGAAALISALAAGGAAFTAGNPLANQTQSYSSAHIVGANASGLTFTYSPDGSFVTGATVVLQGDESTAGLNAPYLIKAGFTGTGPYSGSPPVTGGPSSADDLGSTCDATGAIYASGHTTVTCDFTSSGPSSDAGYLSGSGYYTQQTGQFNVLVTGVDTTGHTGQ